MTDTQWVPLEGRDLILGVRDILDRNPGRHDQRTWLGNVFWDDDLPSRSKVPADQIRAFMYQPLPLAPDDLSTAIPPCGSTGCAFGWAAILSAPQGAFISNGRVYLPGGTSWSITDWVIPRMGLTAEQGTYMFAPNRSTEQLIAILTALAEDIDADVRAVVY